MSHSVPDYIPVAKARRGKGPRTHKKAMALKKRQELDAKMEFAKPQEIDEKEER